MLPENCTVPSENARKVGTARRISDTVLCTCIRLVVRVLAICNLAVTAPAGKTQGLFTARYVFLVLSCGECLDVNVTSTNQSSACCR